MNYLNSTLFNDLCYNNCRSDGSVQDSCDSIANTLELLQFCSKPLKIEVPFRIDIFFRISDTNGWTCDTKKNNNNAFF